MAEIDFAAYDATGHVRAVIEAKRRFGTDAAWAAEFRHNLVEHGVVPVDVVFVLATPDKLYAWPRDVRNDARPDVELDTRPLFAPYFARIATTPADIQPMAFELVIGWWLDDLAASRSEAVPGLEGSELLSALSGARVVRQAAA